MASVLFGQALADEHVTQVPATVLAEDFGATTVGVCFASDGPWDFIIKAGPTAMTVELVL